MSSKISFHRYLASGAMLIALSASTVLGENLSNVQGSFNAVGVGVVQGGTLLASDGGSGTASHIGQFSFTMLQTINLATLTGSGSFVLAFPSGDKIYGSLLGAVDPSNGHIVLSLTIAGGTGRFQDATGSLIFERFFSDTSTLPAFETNGGSVKGTISIPGH